MADVNISKYRASVVRDGSKPASPGFVVSEGQDPVNPPGTNNYVPYTGATANVELGEYGLESGFVTLDTTPTNTPTDQGTIYWDDSRSTAALIMNGTLQHIGQDVFFYVKNSSGSSIPKGTAVRFAGTNGASGHILIEPFLANGTYPSSYFMGVTSETIANGAFGQVMHFGELTGINTSGFTAGALLYASTTVAGGFQTTAPVAPNNIVLIAAAINSTNNGAIIVRPQIGSNINNDEGVKITSPTTGDLLQLQAGGLWENKTLAQVIGSAYVPSTRTLTINGTAFDLSANRSWTVGDVRTDGSYSNPSWISALAWSKITGTPTTLSGYGITDAVPSSRTITINGVTQDLSANRTFNVGTVTSVGLSSATSGVTIGSTPVTSSGTITLAIATATATQNGLLSSTDWSTFNNKQNALTNPVTGTGTTNYLAKFTGSTTVGNSQIFDNGTNVGIGTASPTVAAGLGLVLNGQAGQTRLAFKNNYTGDTSGDGVQFALIGGSSAFVFQNRESDGYFSFETNGNEVFRTSGGNVLIGTTSDNGARLQVSGTATISNRLLVGTTSGVGQDFVSVRFSSADTFSQGLNMVDSNASANGGTFQVFRRSDDTYLGNIRRNGTDNAIYVGGNSYLALGANNTEFARITSGGNVGIGTSSPNVRTEIAGTEAIVALRVTTDNGGVSASNYSEIQLADNGAIRSYWRNVRDGSGATLFSYNDNLRFLASGSERMRITSSGNVGIGTSSPNGLWSGDNRTLNILSPGNFSSELVLSRSAGSVAAASVSNFLSGTTADFGIYTTAALNYVVYTNNTERFRISSTGFVSAGAITNGRLGVRGFTNDSSGYAFEAANASGNSLFLVRNDGNVGVGGIPTTLFYVEGSAPIFTMNRTSGGFINRINFSSGGTNYASIISDAGAGEQRYSIGPSAGWGGYHTFYTDTTERMRITSGGNVGIGTSSPNARLRIQNDNSTIPSLIVRDGGTPTANLIEATSNAYGSSFIVTATGNVGIGTSSPQDPLHISTSGTDKFIRIENSNSYTGIWMNDSGANSGWLLMSGYTNTTSPGDFAIREYGVQTSLVIKQTSGNVLIGTTTDVGARLHVNGDVRTAAPTGGSAVNWRLGTARAGTITPNATVRVEIGGVLVDLDARYV